MRIYIVEDDVTIISILEDIVERQGLGTICGDTADAPAEIEQILAVAPDIILIDLLMPEKDGIQVVRELREMGCGAKFIMISQVSSKEMIAKAYSAGVEFFVQKPINLIEVCKVITNVSKQIENEHALQAIQSIFAAREAVAPVKEESHARERRRIKYILSHSCFWFLFKLFAEGATYDGYFILIGAETGALITQTVQHNKVGIFLFQLL